MLHGGGNTSVKIVERDRFGDELTVLYVKGSGWDLEFIEPAGFSPVRLDHVLKLARLDRLSGQDMVNELVTHMLRASAPVPSIETILHGCMPFRFVDHTHADAVRDHQHAGRRKAHPRALWQGGDRHPVPDAGVRSRPGRGTRVCSCCDAGDRRRP